MQQIPGVVITQYEAFSDQRGKLIQFVTDAQLQEIGFELGQVYVLTFDQAGCVRGNHFHNRSREIFCVIEGVIEIFLENVDTKEQFYQKIDTAGNVFYNISIETRIAHALRCISDRAVVVSLSTERYKSDDEDKIIYKLI